MLRAHCRKILHLPIQQSTFRTLRHILESVHAIFLTCSDHLFFLFFSLPSSHLTVSAPSDETHAHTRKHG